MDKLQSSFATILESAAHLQYYYWSFRAVLCPMQTTNTALILPPLQFCICWLSNSSFAPSCSFKPPPVALRFPASTCGFAFSCSPHFFRSLPPVVPFLSPSFHHPVLSPMLPILSDPSSPFPIHQCCPTANNSSPSTSCSLAGYCKCALL